MSTYHFFSTKTVHDRRILRDDSMELLVIFKVVSMLEVRASDFPLQKFLKLGLYFNLWDRQYMQKSLLNAVVTVTNHNDDINHCLRTIKKDFRLFNFCIHSGYCCW